MRSATVRLLEHIIGADAVEWIGIIARAGILIASMGFGLATLGLLHS